MNILKIGPRFCTAFDIRLTRSLNSVIPIPFSLTFGG